MMRKALTLAVCYFVAACESSSILSAPLPKTESRATPLHFGMHVTPDPEQNPITPPERFTGYHVGEDFEVGSDELDVDVPVFALCTGKILYGGFADGYGGLAIQSCRIQEQQVTVMYGHLQIDSIPKKGIRLESGKEIGKLGAGRSHDTDGNRKHLHLGIHKGTAQDERGYVESEKEIEEFIDPATVIPSSVSSLFEPAIVPYWQTKE